MANKLIDVQQMIDHAELHQGFEDAFADDYYDLDLSISLSEALVVRGLLSKSPFVRSWIFYRMRVDGLFFNQCAERLLFYLCDEDSDVATECADYFLRVKSIPCFIRKVALRKALTSKSVSIFVKLMILPELIKETLRNH